MGRGIAIFNRQRKVGFDLDWLRRLAGMGLREIEGMGVKAGTALEGVGEVEVSVVSDRRIAEVHWRFMRIAGATDVITFEHGEIVISAETAARQAGEHGMSLEREMGLYVVHGLLHLNGYDDLTEEDAAGMRAAQEGVVGRVLREMGG